MILVKVGGGADINWDYIAEDLKKLLNEDVVVLVHGAGVMRDEIAQKLSAPTRTITSPSGISSVFTDQQALDIFLMVYPGLMNKKIVATLQAHSLPAVGLSGVDGALWRAKRKSNVLSVENGKTKLLTNNFTGRVEVVNEKLIRVLVDGGYVPVIAPPAISFENEIVNTDNDWAVAVTAGALQIKKIVYLFEAPGLLRDIQDPKSVITHINAGEIDDFLSFAQGRMKKKILGVKKAFELGVETVYWGDGRIKNPISRAIKGEGTVISRENL